jgi:hypothetical protein
VERGNILCAATGKEGVGLAQKKKKPKAWAEK